MNQADIAMPGSSVTSDRAIHRGLNVARAENLSGLIPIGFVEGVLQ
jgi:hypothetical protein